MLVSRRRILSRIFGNSYSTYHTACDTSKCAACHTTASQCSKCAQSDQFATPSGECTSTCPSGTYTNTAQRKCITCPTDCAECSENGECTSCPPQAPILKLGRCSNVCPKAHFWDAATRDCQPCSSSSCATCTGRRDDQCISCEEGFLMKGGTCSAASCTLAPGLGMCLTTDTDKEVMWWPYVIAIGLCLGLGGGIFWWIRRSRKLRREQTACFAATLDDKEVDRRVQGLGGIFKMLDTMKKRQEPVPGTQEYQHTSGPPPAYSYDSSADKPKHVGFDLKVIPPSPASSDAGNRQDGAILTESATKDNRTEGPPHSHWPSNTVNKSSEPTKEAVVETVDPRKHHCIV